MEIRESYSCTLPPRIAEIFSVLIYYIYKEFWVLSSTPAHSV